MKKLLSFMLMIVSLQGVTQKNKNVSSLKITDNSNLLIPERWDFQEGKVTFMDYKGKKSMKIGSRSGQVVLKDVVFKDGTIEFDVEPHPAEFASSVYFHRKDAKEQEIVYLRVPRIGSKLANQGIQYAPYFDGVNMWDIYPQYQAPAMAKASEWNHMKLVISGKQMKVYVNDMVNTVLEIPKLEGTIAEGSVAFEGEGYITNLQIKPNETEGLASYEGTDMTKHDGQYLRKWAITSPILFPKGTETFAENLPDAEAFSESIDAETAGLVNLTRRFGATPQRKLVWLKTTLTASEPTFTNLQIGFNDEIWVYLNNEMVLVDKNLFQQVGMRKKPGGRLSIDNTVAKLHLKKGENELLIAVANDFYGWGLMARIENAEKIERTDEVSSILNLAEEIKNTPLEPYVGVYAQPASDYKLTIVQKEGKLVAKMVNSDTEFKMKYIGNHTFSIPQVFATIQFRPTENKLNLKQGVDVKEFVKQ
ncbi:family 16 glycoside hydrolase [Runella zeae]|uniref:family 16 glycoside hydrolase n=1 Tax=Runella zeae TaxID=94255 RepID=UPI00048D6F45|nr:family 16 glycoside hydrolase [Runella zeae]